MQVFYKKALFALLLLIVMDALVAGFCISQSYLSLSVLGTQTNDTRWRYIGNTHVAHGGTSSVRIQHPVGERLRYVFKVTDSAFAAAELRLHDRYNRLAQIDWSKYTSATFVAKCAPANSLIFAVLTFDDKLSRMGEFDTYRMPQSFFSCNTKGVPISVDLTRLTIPEWWFNLHGIPMSLQDYQLTKVTKVVFGSSIQSPRNVESSVEITDLYLHGRDYRYLAALAVFLVTGVAAFAIWFFRAHSRALVASLELRMKTDLPLVAYRQLALEPYKDKEKASVSRFIATNYTNPDLDLDAVVVGTGVNRNKINAFLKAELGMTFTVYLNKLRLTEAARLLVEKNEAAVSEIAYLVGYGSVPYFNKLFKEEYGHPPKAFRSLAKQQAQSTEASPQSTEVKNSQQFF